jgi:acetyl esterase/lipase
MVLRGTGYAPAGQVLLYPTLAPVLQRRSPSIDAYGELPSLTRGSIDWFWSHYLRAGQDREPLAVPLRQTDLAGLPPSTVVVAGCDLLRTKDWNTHAGWRRQVSPPLRTWSRARSMASGGWTAC